MGEVSLLVFNVLFWWYDTLVRDEPRPGHLSNLDQDVYSDLKECNPCKSSQELAHNLKTFQSIICSYSKMIGKNEQTGHFGFFILLLRRIRKIAYS